MRPVTQAQVEANRANAQHSTGPKTPEGKANSSQNSFRHGFTVSFCLLPSEDPNEFSALATSLANEHQPSTPTECLLVERMAQHFWLSMRAQNFQTTCLDDEKKLALYLRYQTANDRGFHKCLNDLLKLRAEKRKAELGFVSQEQKKTAEARKQTAETRKQQLHRWALLQAEAEAERALLSNIDFGAPAATIAERVGRLLATERAVNEAA